MKRILISLIRLYQKIPLASHGACHFYPTCSNYMIDAINEYGSIKGCYLGIKRLLRCHPGAKFGYDPVIREEKKNENVKEKFLSWYFIRMILRELKKSSGLLR